MPNQPNRSPEVQAAMKRTYPEGYASNVEALNVDIGDMKLLFAYITQLEAQHTPDNTLPHVIAAEYGEQANPSDVRTGAKHTFHKGDRVRIGEPPNTEDFILVTEPDAGRYCMVRSASDLFAPAYHTVYLGRWAQPVPEEGCCEKEAA